MAKYEVTVCDNEGKMAEKIELDNVGEPQVSGAQYAPLVTFRQSGASSTVPPVAAFRYQAVRSIVLKHQ